MGVKEAPLGYGRYRAVLDEQGFLKDAEILEVNPGFESYFRESASTIIGKSKFEYFKDFYKGKEQEWLKKYHAVAQDGHHFVETVYYEPAQVYFEMNVSSPAKGEFITLFSDVTDKMDADTFYRDILSSIRDAVFITDQDGNFKFVCPNVNYTFGISEEEANEYGKIDCLISKSYRQFFTKEMSGDEHMIKNFEQSVIDKVGKTHHLLIDIKKIALMGGSYMFTCRDITESKLAEHEAEIERDKLKALLDTIPDLIWMKDPKGRYMTCNREFELFYGVPEKQITGKTDKDFVSEETADEYRKNDLLVMNAGRPLRNESELTYRLTDKTILTETTKAPFYSKNGEIIGVLGIARDITDRKRSEMQLQQFMNGLSDATYSINEDGIIEDVNEAASMMTGYTKEELKGAPIWKINKNFPDVDSFLKKFLPLERNKPHIIETIHTAKDSTIIPVEISYRIYDFGEKSHFFAIARDITERRQKESAFREMVHQAPYGIMLVSKEDKPYLVNVALTDMLGYSAEELYEMPFKDFTHPDDFENDHCRYSELLSGEIPQYSIEKRYIHKNGTIIPAALKVSMIKDPFAETGKRALVMVEDLTDKRQSERELEKYLRFFTIANDNFCIADSTGTLHELNPQFPLTLGYTMEELAGSNFLDLVHPDDITATIQEMGNLNKGHKTINFRNRYKKKSGDFITFEWLATPHDGVYYAVARDISESIQAQQKILEAESIHKIMQEAAPYPIQIITEQGKISYLNKQALELWGYETLEELEGKLITDIDRSLNLEDIKQIIKGLTPRQVTQFETTQLHKDGTTIPVEMRVLL